MEELTAQYRCMDENWIDGGVVESGNGPVWTYADSSQYESQA